jgi:hypothetical protein
LDEENLTHAGLVQESRFGSTLLRTMPLLVKSAAALCTCKKESVINMI